MRMLSALVFLSSFVLLRCPVQVHSVDDAALAKKIERIENGLVALPPGAPDTTQPAGKLALSDRMAHYKIPGVSIAVINNNKIEWAKAYGTLVAGKAAPVTTASIFQAASTTKLMVAAITLRLVE